MRQNLCCSEFLSRNTGHFEAFSYEKSEYIEFLSLRIGIYLLLLWLVCCLGFMAYQPLQVI